MLERRLERFPPFYSRIGFRYWYPTLRPAETAEFLAKAPGMRAQAVTEPMRQEKPHEWSAAEQGAIRTVQRLTRGIPRHLQRLMEQVDRLVELNDLPEMDRDVVKQAGANLFLGQSRPKGPGKSERRTSTGSSNEPPSASLEDAR